MEQQKNAERENEREKATPSVRKTAIIVGGSSGIGRETALKLTARGWRVFNISRTPLKEQRIRTVTADAGQEGEIAKAIQSLCEEVGSLDLLVYSAGFSMAAPLEYAKSGDYRYLFEVNYFGAIEAMRASAPYLKKRGGNIVLIGSIGGDMPIPFDSFYSSSKAAVAMLAREANVEFRRYGIKVSALLPGGTATDFTYSRKIYNEEESGAYSPSVKKASCALANIEQGGMNPSLVADSVLKLLAKRNPPPVSVSGGFNGFTRFLYKLLPERMTDWAVRKKFNQK